MAPVVKIMSQSGFVYEKNNFVALVNKDIAIFEDYHKMMDFIRSCKLIYAMLESLSKQPHTEYKGGGEGKEFECLRNELRKMALVNGRGVSEEVWVISSPSPTSRFPTITYRVEIPYVRRLGLKINSSQSTIGSSPTAAKTHGAITGNQAVTGEETQEQRGTKRIEKKRD
ncbi:hypothetical protein AgCh_025713 [Apium graveolens]